MTHSTTSYSWGEIVLVHLPRTDATGTTRRPGLVLYDEGDQDVVVARITTQASRGASDVALAEWKADGLLAPSTVRLAKIATVWKSLVDRWLGSLRPEDTERVRTTWRPLFP